MGGVCDCGTGRSPRSWHWSSVRGWASAWAPTTRYSTRWALNSDNRSLKSGFTVICSPHQTKRGELPHGIDPLLRGGILPLPILRNCRSRSNNAAIDVASLFTRCYELSISLQEGDLLKTTSQERTLPQMKTRYHTSMSQLCESWFLVVSLPNILDQGGAAIEHFTSERTESAAPVHPPVWSRLDVVVP